MLIVNILEVREKIDGSINIKTLEVLLWNILEENSVETLRKAKVQQRAAHE